MVHARFIEKALLAFWVIIMNKSGIGAIGENIAQKYLAKQGYNYEDIIKHFYTGVEIVDI